MPTRSATVRFVIPSEAEGATVSAIYPKPTPSTLHFVIPTGVLMGRRPTQGDEKRLSCSNCSPWARSPPPCHPERSRGTCGSADLSWKCFSTERSVVEGPAVPSRLQPLSGPSIRITNAKVSQPSPLCHPDRSEAEGRDLQCPLGRNHSQNPPSQ